MKKDTYYDKTNLLSHKAPLNMIIGPRGRGKSFEYKTWCIRDFKQNGNQFVWVRRYDSELEPNLKSFMKDLNGAGLFLDVDWKVKKGKLFYTLFIDDEICGYGIALSSASKIKSTSFEGVDKLVYDEFLAPKQARPGYIKDEPQVVLDVMNTVFRLRDFRGAYLVANNVSFDNPHFRSKKIPRIEPGTIWKDPTGMICVEYDYGELYKEAVDQSRIGALFKTDETYYSYAVDNVALEDTSDFVIGNLEGQKQFMFNIQLDNMPYGVYRYKDQGDIFYYICNNFNSTGYTYASMEEFTHGLKGESSLMTSGSQIVKDLKYLYQYNELRFQHLAAKNDVLKIIGLYK